MMSAYGELRGRKVIGNRLSGCLVISERKRFFFSVLFWFWFGYVLSDSYGLRIRRVGGVQFLTKQPFACIC